VLAVSSMSRLTLSWFTNIRWCDVSEVPEVLIDKAAAAIWERFCPDEPYDVDEPEAERRACRADAVVALEVVWPYFVRALARAQAPTELDKLVGGLRRSLGEPLGDHARPWLGAPRQRRAATR
jgi:hypothetical protein